MGEVFDAVDACLARAEEKFDGKVRELGYLPSMSRAQLDRLVLTRVRSVTKLARAAVVEASAALAVMAAYVVRGAK